MNADDIFEWGLSFFQVLSVLIFGSPALAVLAFAMHRSLREIFSPAEDPRSGEREEQMLTDSVSGRSVSAAGPCAETTVSFAMQNAKKKG